MYYPKLCNLTRSRGCNHFISVLHGEKSVGEMLREFEVETYDDYMVRARSVRKAALK